MINKKENLVRTNYEAIIKFYENKNWKKITQRRWLAFKDRVINFVYRVKFKHIKGTNNCLANKHSWITLAWEIIVLSIVEENIKIRKKKKKRELV